MITRIDGYLKEFMITFMEDDKLNGLRFKFC